MTSERLKMHRLSTTRQKDYKTLWVWTPGSYQSSAKRSFPVLYLQDGQNLFGTSRKPGWNAGEVAQKEISSGRVEPLIIVGIENAGPRRADDYTAVEWKGKGGQASNYLGFITDQVKPFVDRTYRTKLPPRSTAIGGSSLGALFSLYAGLSTDTFGAVMAMSPSVFWGNDQIIDFVRDHADPSVRVWLDVGDGETQKMRDGFQRLVLAMKNAGWHGKSRNYDRMLRAFVHKQGKHDEASWGARFGLALRHLFPTPRPPASAHNVSSRKSQQPARRR